MFDGRLKNITDDEEICDMAQEMVSVTSIDNIDPFHGAGEHAALLSTIMLYIYHYIDKNILSLHSILVMLYIFQNDIELYYLTMDSVDKEKSESFKKRTHLTEQCISKAFLHHYMGDCIHRIKQIQDKGL